MLFSPLGATGGKGLRDALEGVGGPSGDARRASGGPQASGTPVGAPGALESTARVETDAEAKARRAANEEKRLERVADNVAAGDLFGVSATDLRLLRDRNP